jgi:hypothetical protein
VHSFARFGGASRASSEGPLGATIPVGTAALAGVLLLGFRRARKAWALLGCLLLVSLLGFATGCGSSSGSRTTTSTEVPAGTYTVTLTGTDTTTSSITASTTFTVTVQ